MSSLNRPSLGASRGVLPIAAALAILVIIVSRVEQPLQPPPVPPAAPAAEISPARKYDYEDLRNRITYARATLGETRRALTDVEPASLSNTIHALYAMRWHRGVVHLTKAMWRLEKEKYPELAWTHIAEAPARIALASTLNRMEIVGTEAYLDYIRAHKKDPHEFNRSQVAVALGFNGHASDLAYLEEMADGANHYVAQSAITGLSLFGGPAARRTLVALAERHGDSPRGIFISQMIQLLDK